MTAHALNRAGAGALSGRQARALGALLGETTIDAAARVAGVNERTLRRWLDRDERFQAAYRRARLTVVRHAIAALQRAAAEAVERLHTARRELQEGRERLARTETADPMAAEAARPRGTFGRLRA